MHWRDDRGNRLISQGRYYILEIPNTKLPGNLEHYENIQQNNNRNREKKQLKNSETIIIKKSTNENFSDIKKDMQDMPIKI